MCAGDATGADAGQVGSHGSVGPSRSSLGGNDEGGGFVPATKKRTVSLKLQSQLQILSKEELHGEVVHHSDLFFDQDLILPPRLGSWKHSIMSPTEQEEK